MEHHLDRLAKDYRGQAAVLALDANAGETPERVAAFAREKGLALPIVLDPGGRTADLFGTEVTTTTVVIDGKGVGRSPHGNIVVTGFRVASLSESAAPRPVLISQALADFEQVRTENPTTFYSIENSIRGEGKASGWAIKPQEHERHTAIFRLASPITAAAGPVRLRVVIGQDFGGKHTIGRLRLSATADDQARLGQHGG